MAEGVGSPGNLTEDVLTSLEALAAPGASFARSGNVGSNTYLQLGTVITSATGFPIRLNNAFLIFIAVQNELINTFDVEIIEWDGSTETVLATVSVVSSLGEDFTPVSPIPVTFGNSIRCKVSSGASKNPVVIAFTVGEVPA